MSTWIAITVVIAASGMLLTYYLGYSAGQRDGFEKGRETGRREGSIKAFAVGYDRGKHEREAAAEEAEAADTSGCLPMVLFIGLVGPPLIWAMHRLW